MSGDDPLLDQADALMRRHRVFVAGAQAEAAGAKPAPGLDNGSDAGSDDLPLLTEVVGTCRPVAADQEAAADGRLSQLLAEHRAALALELENWLDEQLPQLVIRAMDGITDHLVALITNRAREELLPLLDASLQPGDEALRQ